MEVKGQSTELCPSATRAQRLKEATGGPAQGGQQGGLAIRCHPTARAAASDARWDQKLSLNQRSRDMRRGSSDRELAILPDSGIKGS